MKIVRFNQEKHYEQIVQMLADYNWEPWKADLFGKYYFCVMDGKTIVLFGGMYLYDVKVYGRLGLVLMNKKAQKNQREESFNLLFNKLNSICVAKKVQGIEYASSNEFMVNKLVKNYGFVKHTNKNSDMLYKAFSNDDFSFLNEEG